MKYFGKKRFRQKRKYNILSLEDPDVVFEIERKDYQDYLKSKGENYKKKTFNNKHLENAFSNKTYSRAMKNIPQEEKDVLYFYVVECMPLSKVCKELNKSKCEVLSLKKSAIKHFKSNLNGYNKTYKKSGVPNE